jgi:hypothetical protein
MRPEARHGLLRAFVGVGRACRQFVGGTVDVAVLVLVELHQAVDHRLRLLRRGGVVEPDQRLAIDALGRMGKSRRTALTSKAGKRAASARGTDAGWSRK